MSQMTGKERITRILQRKPTDRVGLYENFWADTQSAWTAQGHLRAEESMARHFGFDMDEAYCFDMVADLDFTKQVLAETEDTITYLDGNGAVLKEHKHHDSTPEHVDFHVCDRESWETLIKPKLTADPRRIDFVLYRRVRRECREDERFFVLSALNVFECMHRVCGHENLLMGMITDPEWVLDMAQTYAQLTLELETLLFEREGWPDGVWYYEDMGYKGSPFFSPQMYLDLLQPAHRLLFDHAHAHHLPVILHSCGFVEPLLPGMIDAGIDCLEAMEVKAGMDLAKLHAQFGDKIAFMGGLDVRALYSGCQADIDTELSLRLPPILHGHNYVVHSDHSIPETVAYETYRYFIEQSLRLGTYADFDATASEQEASL